MCRNNSFLKATYMFTQSNLSVILQSTFAKEANP